MGVCCAKPKLVAQAAQTDPWQYEQAANSTYMVAAGVMHSFDLSLCLPQHHTFVSEDKEQECGYESEDSVLAASPNTSTDNPEFGNSVEEPSSSSKSVAFPTMHNQVWKKHKLSNEEFTVNQYCITTLVKLQPYSRIFCTKNREFLIEVFNKKQLQETTEGEAALQRAYAASEILSTAAHPNLLHLIEVIDSPASNKLYLVYEYAEFVSWSICSEAKAKVLFQQMLSVLKYLHQTLGLIHADFTLKNVLASQNGLLKVYGLGWAQHIADGVSECNSASYKVMPPELCGGRNRAGTAADIWAAGVCLYELVEGKPPFSASRLLELCKAIRTEAPAVPTQCSPQFEDLLVGLLDKSPTSRLNIDEILRHPWLA